MLNIWGVQLHVIIWFKDRGIDVVKFQLSVHQFVCLFVEAIISSSRKCSVMCETQENIYIKKWVGYEKEMFFITYPTKMIFKCPCIQYPLANVNWYVQSLASSVSSAKSVKFNQFLRNSQTLPKPKNVRKGALITARYKVAPSDFVWNIGKCTKLCTKSLQCIRLHCMTLFDINVQKYPQEIRFYIKFCILVMYYA